MELEEKSYTNLGNGYHSLGEEARAIEYHLQALGVIQKLGLPEAEQRVYCNLGNSYQRLEEYDTALDYYQKQLDIGLKHGYLLAQEVAYGNLGNTYKSLGDYTQALNYQQKSLTVALKIQDKEAVGRTYGNLGHAYFYLGKYAEALECQKKGLKICQEINHQQGIMNSYTNLGRVYLSLHRSVEAERSFCQSVQISQLLLRNAKSPQLQVSFFEGLSTSYLFLEKMLLSQGRMKKALEISDQRRYQALSFLISQKLQLTQQEDSSLSFEKMRQLAQKLQTIFVIYSFAQSKEKIYAWIVTSNEERFYSTSLQIKDNAFFDHAAIFNAFPYQGEQKRPTRRGVSPSVEFQKKLASWYDTLIAPLKPHLPAKESGEILTFIPDDFLAHLPFGAFYNQQEDKYLIEDYPVSVAPSIQVVSFLDQFPKKSCHEVLLMGNPTISKQADGDLPYAEFEVRDTLVPIMNHLTTHVFTQDKATPVSVLAYAPSARLIHIASHGVPHQKPLEKPDPHSVFEGLFKLAIDKDHHLGHLHAGEIALMHLKADLVFMSACHLGRGNLKQEGSIGPVWSFLGAGAKSTIGSYWPLPEGEMTVKMVEVFYRYYLGIGVSQLNKARALREAVLMAMKTERDKPSQWGSFFLTGLID
ncbi:MAG: CHAT domain-containing protein [Candidatus Rhabdochlamydia sp.]